MTELREVRVHPNSMAARKWKRTTWTTYTPKELFVRAARARAAGEGARADALRRAAARAGVTEVICR